MSSIINEKYISNNIKASEKISSKGKKKDQQINDSETPVSLLKATDKSDVSVSDDKDALEEAQKMIQQLKSLIIVNHAASESEHSSIIPLKKTETPASCTEPSGIIRENRSENKSEMRTEKFRDSEEKELNEKLKMVRELKSAMISHVEDGIKGNKYVINNKNPKKTSRRKKKTSEKKKKVESDVDHDKGLDRDGVSVRDNREAYAELKREIEKSIKALEKLKNGGFISEKEYVESKKLLVKKLELAEFMLHKETQRIEIETLRDKVMEFMRRFMEEGGINKEKLKLKFYLQALQKLYDQGVIPQDLYLKKRRLIEDTMAIYDMVIENIEEVFDSFIKRLSLEISKAKEEFDSLSTREERERTTKHKTRKGGEGWKEIKILSKFFGKKKKDDGYMEYNIAMEELQNIYTRLKGRESVSEMILLVKRKMEEVLGIQEELTHLQLAERIKNDERLDKNVKTALTSFLEKMVMKEYAGELTDSEVQEVYGECRGILELIYTTIKPALRLSEDEDEKKWIKEGAEKEKGDDIEPEDEGKGSQPKILKELDESNDNAEKMVKKDAKKGNTVSVDMRNQEKESSGKVSSKKKRSIFERINEFFGV